MSYELEKLFRVYDMTEQVGQAIEVKPHPENYDAYILISTEGKQAEKYYGKLHLALPNKQAKLLAKAILELVGE